MLSSNIIPAEDYTRITSLIFSVLESSGAKTSRACIFFAIAGAMILQDRYGIKARPVAGAAFYRVNDNTGFTIAYCDQDSAFVTSSAKAFHCWVETETHVVDFMAPIFQDAVNSANREESVPARMFQAGHQEMSTSPASLLREGDHFHMSNPPLAQEIFERWADRDGNLEVLDVFMNWYRRPPAVLPQEFVAKSNKGDNIRYQLRNVKIEGSWRN